MTKMVVGLGKIGSRRDFAIDASLCVCYGVCVFPNSVRLENIYIYNIYNIL